MKAYDIHMRTYEVTVTYYLKWEGRAERGAKQWLVTGAKPRPLDVAMQFGSDLGLTWKSHIYNYRIESITIKEV